MSKDNALNNANEIVVKNSLGNELLLMKCHEIERSKDKKYNEVMISNFSLISGNLTQAGLQVANQSQTLSQIVKQAPNGLFTATTDPVNLSKFANGTTTTMVRDSSKRLAGHAGFEELELLNTINPAILLSAGMQVMSAVSGTYYLYKINSQLTDMDVKLEELLQIHHDENIGRLVAARKALSEIADREFVDYVDINTIRNFRIAADEIHEEYMYRLKREGNELMSAKDEKQEKQKLDKINFSMTIAFEANKLSLFSQLIEIAIRMKIGGQTELIRDLSKQLQNNYENSFYHNIEKEVEKIFSRWLKKGKDELVSQARAYKKAKGGIFKINPFGGWGILGELAVNGAGVLCSKVRLSNAEKKVVMKSDALCSTKKNMKQNKENDNIDFIIKEMLAIPTQQREILLVVDEESKNKRVFIPAESCPHD